MKRRAFTLIELLIVVAIIAILAAIAVPNFLEAQVRAKVSRVKADMRSIATGLESYRIDYNVYPPMSDAPLTDRPYTTAPGFHSRIPSYITTPISYMTSIPEDVFVPASTFSNPTYPLSTRVGFRFAYFNYDNYLRDNPASTTFPVRKNDAGNWLFYSYGPDKDVLNGPANSVYVNYDPTNGTVSPGNVFRTQKTNDRYIPS